MIDTARSPQQWNFSEAVLQGAVRLDRRVWLPVPLLLCAILFLWATKPQGTFESVPLLAVLNFLSYAVVALGISGIIGQTFVQQGRPSHLMLGCGALIWGCAGLVMTFGTVSNDRFPCNFNTIVTYHNCCVWAASFCHLAGVAVSRKWRVELKHPKLVLFTVYLLALGAGLVLLVATLYETLPVFFVPGRGGTLVRQFVLGSAVAMFTLTATLLLCESGPVSACIRWYACALLLMAVGVLAVMMQHAPGGWLAWTGRGTQYLASIYLLAAAMLHRDDPVTEGVSLGEAVNEMAQKHRFTFTLAASLVFLAAAIRLLFPMSLGAEFPFVTFYPAVILAAGYGGLGPGLIATVFSVFMAGWVRTTLGGDISFDTWSGVRIACFTASGIIASGLGMVLHQLQRRAVEAEAEARFASERAAGAQRLRAAKVKLQQSEGLFQTVIATANEGAWIIDADRTATYVNDRLAQILGKPKGEILGRVIDELVCAEDLPLLRRQLELREKGICSKYMLRVPQPDGSTAWIQISGSPLSDGDGRYCGSFAMCTDITDRKRIEDELHQLTLELEQRVEERSEELQRLNRELESFCFSISHELRAPIARLSAFSALIREALEEERPEELPHLSERIEAASVKLRTVIDTLLLMNRLSRAKVEREQIDLSELAQRTVNDLREEVPRREVAVKIEPGLTVHGDRGMLGICLRNLFHNAFKYTGKTEAPRIEFARQEHPEPAYYIRDNGAGFDMSFSDKLFEPFSRLHNDYEFEGSGTGLTTVQRIVERHGGRIWAEGAPGQGATFYFTIEESGKVR
ncbi:sensor histidine kinase [Geomesophilobacter sediminis]|uniref:histidine kinase n=1 Tax=Geomesophilobacter sediminis TaxID=2798584 RepID=A0A8J7JAI3_9BACT|nr:ATP-binding protein [Geomesophilobacter sediminis]MBJ6723368.1 PAS domain S-box protein [Geomesophilobacter sediminis]